MKLLFTILCSVICLAVGFAQENTPGKQSDGQEKSQTDTTVFNKVKVMPKYKGGMQELYSDINDNLKYPKEARKAGIKGRVFLSFIVEKNGNISNVKVMKKLGYGCDEAAVAALQGLAFDEPAYNDNNPVRMRLNIPVGFGRD